MKKKKSNQFTSELYLLCAALWAIYCSCCFVAEITTGGTMPPSTENYDIYLSLDEFDSVNITYLDSHWDLTRS